MIIMVKKTDRYWTVWTITIRQWPKKRYKDMHLTSILTLKFKRADFVILVWQCISPYSRCNFTLDFFSNGLLQKKSKHGSGDWAHGISRGIEGRADKNSRSQFLKSWISGGFKGKLMWNFHGSWFLTLEYPKGVTQFYGISRGENLFSPEFLKVKLQI